VTRFKEYFKSTSKKQRELVAARFKAVAYQANAANKGDTVYYCGDPYNFCDAK
jgi:deuterolysin